MSERFLDQIIEKGLKGAQLMPHEIVEKIIRGKVSKAEAMVLDAQWTSLRESVLSQIEEHDVDPTKMVPLSDVSGSMTGTPMHVAIAMGILISEITHEAFRGLVMTFESRPRWHKLDSSMTIVEKVQSLARAPWGGSTNFQAAQELVLDVATQHKLDREDVPILIVFSDMQFNQASGYSWYSHFNNNASPKDRMVTMHQEIEKRYATVGANLGWQDTTAPVIVYWNLRNTGGHPVERDSEGAVLLSGFSPSLLKLVMQGKVLEDVEVEVVQADGSTTTEKVRVSPEQILEKLLLDAQYDPVKEIIGESEEGKLAFVDVVPAEDMLD